VPGGWSAPGMRCVRLVGRRVHDPRVDLVAGGTVNYRRCLEVSQSESTVIPQKADFANVSDADLLQIAQDFEVVDKNEKTMLGQALDLRNSCGHPVKYRPGEKKVSSFIEDVLQIVFGVTN
jgi:hypothetical protein